MIELSGQVDEYGFFVLVTFHVLIPDEHLDLLLDHLRVSPEHGDVPDDVRCQLLVSVTLLRLHHLYGVGLDHESTLLHDNLLLLLLLLRLLRRLLFVDALRDQHLADVILLELGVDLDLFLVFGEVGLVELLHEELDLGVAQLHHARLEILSRHRRGRLELSDRDLISFVEHAEDGRLKHVNNQLVLFWRV